jgi:hypothetical protein
MMPITPELLDKLLKDYKSPDDMFGDDGLLQQLTKAVVERPLQGEMTHYLGYEKHAPEGKNSGNSRNGKSRKRFAPSAGKFRLMSRATATPASSRSSSKSGRRALAASLDLHHFDVRQKDDLPRDQSTFAGDLWGGSFTLPHLDCHRFCD